MRLSKVLWIIPSVLAILALARFRHELFKTPRVRVGPLQSQVPVGDTMRLFVIGDAGTGSASQYQVARAMEARCLVSKPYGIILLGDNFYQAGVSSVEDPQWQTKLLQPYGSPCLADLPFYPILGNHDYKGNPAAQIEYSLINPRWRFPNRFYAVKFGDLLRLVASDSQLADVCFRPSYCSTDFLLENVKKHDAAWTIAMGHHPLRSASAKADGGGHAGGWRGFFLTPLLCDHADLFLAGHAHHLEHRRVEGCPMELVIAGGAGADLYQIKTEPESMFARATNGFVELELSSTQLAIRFFDINGALLHEGKKHK